LKCTRNYENLPRNDFKQLTYVKIIYQELWRG